LVAVLAVVAIAAGAFLAVSGKGGKIAQALQNVVGMGSPTPPPTCPLTGKPAPGGSVPQRPALAVKVENYPQARPQYGLQSADIVYEELVEGGITRFMGIWQCHDAARIEPVRSVRTTDPKILVQYGHPIFGYAGGAPWIMNMVKATHQITDVNMIADPQLYHRDPARYEPHNLFTSTQELWNGAHSTAGPPSPVFTYSATPNVPGARPVHDIHLDFSYYSDVHWIWNASKGEWMRYYGTQPAMLTSGQQTATNVVVQKVKVTYGSMSDVLGTPSPVLTLTGTGAAWVCSDGKCVAGKWVRTSLKTTTQFETKSGQVIPLAPGNTYVELYPSTSPAPTFH
jgi:hypothetical protein